MVPAHSYFTLPTPTIVHRTCVGIGLPPVTRFKGIPDVHYGDDVRWVCGDKGVSEWVLTGTTISGERIKLRGCDLWQFRGDLVTRKDSYWKIVV
jgi:hypothetical protein